MEALAGFRQPQHLHCLPLSTHHSWAAEIPGRRAFLTSASASLSAPHFARGMSEGYQTASSTSLLLLCAAKHVERREAIGKGTCLNGAYPEIIRRCKVATSSFSPSKPYMPRGTIRCEAGPSVSDTVGTTWNGSLVSSSVPTRGQRFRAFCFYTFTYIVAIPLFLVMLAIHPFVLLLDMHKRKAHHLINKLWARLTILPFYKTEIEGLENLPGPDEPAVYVSNHQSFLDIYTLFLLGRPFKFISKTSNFFIPIIGWSMYLTGHVPLRRMDTKSQIDCLKHCVTLVKRGVSVFFFPEGTRTKDAKMADFKKGAFTVAVKAKVPVIPVSLIGTGKLMPNGLEGTLRSGSVKVVIHPPLRGSNSDELCKQARIVIAECLVKHGLEVH